jgi:hypothetical protein
MQMPLEQQYQFKGTYIEQIYRWAEDEYGSEAWDRYFAPEGEAWRRRVLPNAWYEAATVDKVLRRIVQEHNLEYSKTVADLAAKTSSSDLPTVYRVFFRVMSPAGVFRFMPQLWRAYCSHAEMQVVENTPGYCVVDTVGIPDWLVEFTRGSMCGFMAQVVTLTGGGSPEARIVKDSLEEQGRWVGYHRLRGQVRYT